MNILFTYPYLFNPLHGGVERVTDILCREFLKLGHRVFYLNCYQKQLDSYSYPVPVTCLPCAVFYSIENRKFYHNFLREKEIDIVINQEGLYEFCDFFCNTGNEQIKVFSVIHNNPLVDYDFLWSTISPLRNSTFIEKLKRLTRCFLYFKIKRCRWISLKKHYHLFLSNKSEVVLLSDYYVPSLMKIAPFLKHRVSAIPNPISYPQIEKIPVKFKEIIFVGRLDNRSKQITKLLEIWKKVCQDYPDWNLSIIGDGPDKEMLINKSELLHLKNLRFYGFQNPEPFYRKASIICMTSIFEGFPMVLVEAMQFGCVPIAFHSFAAINDIIKNNTTGILVTPFNEKEYISKLESLINNFEQRQKLSVNAFASVQRFNPDLIINQWIKLIESKPI